MQAARLQAVRPIIDVELPEPFLWQWSPSDSYEFVSLRNDRVRIDPAISVHNVGFGPALDVQAELSQLGIKWRSDDERRLISLFSLGGFTATTNANGHYEFYRPNNGSINLFHSPGATSKHSLGVIEPGKAGKINIDIFDISAALLVGLNVIELGYSKALEQEKNTAVEFTLTITYKTAGGEKILHKLNLSMSARQANFFDEAGILRLRSSKMSWNAIQTQIQLRLSQPRVVEKMSVWAALLGSALGYEAALNQLTGLTRRQRTAFIVRKRRDLRRLIAREVAWIRVAIQSTYYALKQAIKRR